MEVREGESMNWKEKVEELIRQYKHSFLVIAFTTIFLMWSGAGKQYLLVAAVVLAIGSIIIYCGNQLSGFYGMAVAVSCTIAALYDHLEITIGSNRNEIIGSVFMIFLLTSVIILMYTLLEISGVTRRRTVILISFLCSVCFVVVVIVLGRYIPEFFADFVWLAGIYGIIFFSSMLSILLFGYIEDVYKVLMVSYGMIFVFLFMVVVSIIVEDGSLLELFVPDGEIPRKKK